MYIPDLTYDIMINGVMVGGGHTNLDMTINPVETKEIVSFQNIQKNSLASAIHSIVSAEGVIDLKVKGTAYFKLLGFKIPIRLNPQNKFQFMMKLEIK